jgi:very-short-patch-repair endonuclease
VNQYYPAIFYPRLILKFIAENPTPNFKQHSHIIDSNQANLPNKETNDSNYVLNKIFYILICINLFISICFYFLGLYPLWLIVAVWTSINLGCSCFISNLHKQSSKKNIPSSIQLKTKKENKIVMRLPKREAKLNLWLNEKVLQPVGESDAQNGVSEKTFYQITKRFFPNIVQGVAFHNPKFHHPYSADFLIVHTSGLSIDIEIDEPYVGNTKEPHHCIDQRKDNVRNQFFTQNNWVVIRFSEKQVVKYPYRCCKVIAQVIARVSGDFTFLSQLNNVPSLPPEPMWTIKQAKNWAKDNYRKTYLP